MNILFGIRGLYPEVRGGASIFCTELIKKMSLINGVSIVVLHPGYEYGFENYQNIKEFPLRFGNNGLSYYIKVNKFIKKMNFNKTDVYFSDGFSLIFTSAKVKKKCIYHHHAFGCLHKWFYFDCIKYGVFSFLKIYFKNTITKFLIKHMVRKCGRVVSQGEKISEMLKNKCGIESDKLVFAPAPPFHCVKQQVLKKKNNKMIFLSIGGLHYYKGYTYLIDAFNELSNRIKLYIIGEGPLEKKLVRRKHNENIHLLGPIYESSVLSEWYNKADCFILTSLAEGSPLVISEALSHSLPVIATDVGGVSEFIDNSNGILINSGSRKEIENAVNTLLNKTDNELNCMAVESYKKYKAVMSWQDQAQIFNKHFSELRKVEE